MGKMFGEPLMIIVGGGIALFQAFMEVLIAFHVPLTMQQEVSLTTLVGLLLASIARTQTTPMATLPAGVAAQIAANNAPPAPPNAPIPPTATPVVIPPAGVGPGTAAGPGTIHLTAGTAKDTTP